MAALDRRSWDIAGHFRNPKAFMAFKRPGSDSPRHLQLHTLKSAPKAGFQLF